MATSHHQKKDWDGHREWVSIVVGLINVLTGKCGSSTTMFGFAE